MNKNREFRESIIYNYIYNYFCKDGKLKVKLDNDDTKTFRLIKECDLQLYEGVASSPKTLNHTQRKNLLNTTY